MTIKGTLETFNLRELLQMLAFNQKVGTLVLATERGTQTVYVDRGRVTFVTGDEQADRALLRVLHREGLVPPDRLQRALQIQETTGRHLGTVLAELGACDQQELARACAVAAGERFLTLQLTSVSHFEFVDGKVVNPEGKEGKPLEPALVVDSLLLDLTRKMDQWAELSRVIPGLGEVYELTGVGVELADATSGRGLDPALAERVVGAYDGFRTLAEIGEVSSVDELTVLESTAAFLEAGALRAVPTVDLFARGEDLLARGEAHRSLPLLRRVVEREDAPLESRLRLADALESSGLRAESAAELDTYAAQHGDGEPLVVFDAMHRALALRDTDVATAARVCDFYLRNRPWLEGRREQALHTLRALIHGAVTGRRPAEAASRLAQFIRNGDAPSEDLLVLADLYASCGQRPEAAAALYRRAEELLTSGRDTQGRELLQRALQLDPTRADARGRLQMLDGQSRKRRRRRRLVVFLVLLGVLLCGAGAAWWTYNREANEAVRTVRERAERAVDAAESEAYELLDAFSERVARASTAEEPDLGLVAAAETLMREMQQVLGRADSAIYEFASELDHYQATERQGANRVMLRHLEARRETALRRAEHTIDAARERGRSSLEVGERAHTDGNFEEARTHLLTARNLAFEDPSLRSRATVLLGHVEAYIADFEAAHGRLVAARDASAYDEAYRIGIDILVRQLDSDLTRDVRLPVRIKTDPPGALVRLGDEVATDRTPCVLAYSPFGDTELVLWMAGCVPQRVTLRSFDRIVDDPEAARSWEPALDVSLPVGPAWEIPAEEGPFAALWTTVGIPVLLLDDGSAAQSVDVEAGRLGLRVAFQRPNPVRAGGALAGGVEWRIVGQRTLVVRPSNGAAWETQVLGRLSLAPAFSHGTLAVLDDLGTVYGLDVATGRERWRTALGTPPCHRPYASELGFLVSTFGNGAHVVDAASGTSRALAHEARGLTLALPFGSGAVVLGGTSGKAWTVGEDGKIEPCGEAHPLDAGEPWVSKAGVAWIEADGVRWLGAASDAPVPVPSLGGEVTAVTGRGETLYACSQDGTVRAATLAALAEPAWETPLGRGAATAVLVSGDYLLVLVDGGLVGLAR